MDAERDRAEAAAYGCRLCTGRDPANRSVHPISVPPRLRVADAITFAQPRKYFETISTFPRDCALLSTKKSSVANASPVAAGEASSRALRYQAGPTSFACRAGEQLSAPCMPATLVPDFQTPPHGCYTGAATRRLIEVVAGIDGAYKCPIGKTGQPWTPRR